MGVPTPHGFTAGDTVTISGTGDAWRGTKTITRTVGNLVLMYNTTII